MYRYTRTEPRTYPIRLFRNDPEWRPPPVAPIDYCYVQPHHIPSVNAMCREFFWPGIDCKFLGHWVVQFKWGGGGQGDGNLGGKAEKRGRQTKEKRTKLHNNT